MWNPRLLALLAERIILKRETREIQDDENRRFQVLCDLVCDGLLDIGDAQEAIIKDWIAAYHLYEEWSFGEWLNEGGADESPPPSLFWLYCCLCKHRHRL
jgi:hypothetical protein